MNQQMQALAAANAANVEAIHSLAHTSLKATERLMNLNLGLARSSLRLGADCARPAPGGDWRQVVSQQNSGLRKGAEEAASYLRSIYDLSAETQAELNEVISSRVGELSESVNELLDALAQSAPAGSGNAMGLIKSAFAGTCSAYAQMMKAGAQPAAAAPKRSKRAQ